MTREVNVFDHVRFLAALNEVTESAQRATPCEKSGKEGTILAVNPNGEGRYCPIRWKLSTDGQLVGSAANQANWACRVELVLNQDRWYDSRYPKARPPAISDKEIIEWLAKCGYPFGFLRELRRLTPLERYSNLYGMHVQIYR